MVHYVIRRLFLMIPTLIGITLVVFLTMAMSPGGIGASLLDTEGSMRPEEAKARREYYERRYGLNKPLYVQYGRWLNQISPIGFTLDEDGTLGRLTLKWPDLGESFIRHRPVLDVILEALPITLLLNLTSAVLIYSIAILSGIYAARHRGKLLDVGTGTAFITLWSLPTMWVGVMLIGFLANKDYLPVFPTGGVHDTLADTMPFLPRWVSDPATGAATFQRGWLLDTAWHLVLPVACMTYGGFAFLSKLMRASVLESLSADFVRTARAKGVSERVLLFRHVLRNSVLPLITVAAGLLPSLLGGSLIIESIFSINGMGKLMIDAIGMRDRELVLSEAFVISLISSLSLLLADLCYAVADPRVSYE